ncbi:MAG TPA: alpha/beta family hydrolase [Terracidiphilus sp.]|nr:alpha/beta family hydrolase [Terracidiphilus sp.]
MQGCEAYSDISNPDAPVRGYLHRASDPASGCLILTHGAGANCQSLLLTTLANAFSAAGLTVLRCDLPFRQLRPHGPPMRGSAERDQQGLRAAVESMRRVVGGKVCLGGHSYGGRQASILASSESQLVDRLLLLSYPLHPPKKPDELRTRHFPALQVPSLFVSGTRDGFATMAEMEAALKLIPARTELMQVSGAGHELMTSRNRDVIAQQIVSQFLAFAHSAA